MTKVQFIFVIIVVYLFGCFTTCILSDKKPEVKKVDSLEIKRNIRLDSIARAVGENNKKLIGIDYRTMNLIDSMNNNHKKINEERKQILNFNNDSRSRYRDSIERANNIN